MLDFLGIGAQKCGTTWLHVNLKRHPAVFLPEPKELHFWNRPDGRDLAWYRDVFAGTAPGVLGGEITPAYGFLPIATIEAVRREFPDLRLIYCLRNPIERAWSSALMALGRAEMTLDEASDQWFIDHFHSAGSRARGDYEACLRNWRAVFEPARIQVVLFDRIVACPLRVLREVAGGLGIDAAFFDTVAPELLAQPQNSGQGHPLRPSLRPVLERLWRPRVSRLADYLGVDLDHWR